MLFEQPFVCCDNLFDNQNIKRCLDSDTKIKTTE